MILDMSNFVMPWKMFWLWYILANYWVKLIQPFGMLYMVVCLQSQVSVAMAKISMWWTKLCCTHTWLRLGNCLWKLNVMLPCLMFCSIVASWDLLLANWYIADFSHGLLINVWMVVQHGGLCIHVCIASWFGFVTCELVQQVHWLRIMVTDLCILVVSKKVSIHVLMVELGILCNSPSGKMCIASNLLMVLL